jgi:hypothetical protein
VSPKNVFALCVVCGVLLGLPGAFGQEEGAPPSAPEATSEEAAPAEVAEEAVAEEGAPPATPEATPEEGRPVEGGEAPAEATPEEGPPVEGEEAPAEAAPEPSDLEPSEASLEQWIDDVTHPADWLTWGGELRVQQTYQDNAIDFLDEFPDTWNYFRIRASVWAQAGRFLVAEDAGIDNGLSGYVRLTAEPRYFTQDDLIADDPMWDEGIVENLYVDWTRVAGLPVSMRVGRQDLAYGPPGRWFVVFDGTPLDDSRSIYSDAIKTTIHLDDSVENPNGFDVDVFYANNDGTQDRIDPINESHLLVSEFDTKLFGIYAMNRQVAGHEFHGYYVYKDDDRIGRGWPGGQIVHTVGGLGTGKIGRNWDYYAELAGQWGKLASRTRRGLGFSSDLGYTFAEATWTPRVHGGYEYLSGDDPSSRRWEGWDPVLARYPHFSWIMAYRYLFEYGLPGYYTNLQRYTAGVSVNPTEKTQVSLDYHFLRANERIGPPVFPLGPGLKRGHLVVAGVKHQFTKFIDGALLGEYFHPESFYASSSDSAILLRWEVGVKF